MESQWSYSTNNYSLSLACYIARMKSKYTFQLHLTLRVRILFLGCFLPIGNFGWNKKLQKTSLNQDSNISAQHHKTQCYLEKANNQKLGFFVGFQYINLLQNALEDVVNEFYRSDIRFDSLGLRADFPSNTFKGYDMGISYRFNRNWAVLFNAGFHYSDITAKDRFHTLMGVVQYSYDTGRVKPFLHMGGAAVSYKYKDHKDVMLDSQYMLHDVVLEGKTGGWVVGTGAHIYVVGNLYVLGSVTYAHLAERQVTIYSGLDNYGEPGIKCDVKSLLITVNLEWEL